MTLEQALEQNPYDPSKGNESAYLRYLKYNVDGFYDIGIEEIRKLWKSRCKKEKGMKQLIYKEDVLREISTCDDEIFATEAEREYLWERIQMLPSVDHVIHGKWKRIPSNCGASFECSECGEKTTETVMWEPRYEYCPMCGARMDEE